MNRTEALFLWSAVAVYALSFLLFLASMAFGKPRWQGRAFVVSAAAFGLHSGAILARFSALGHFPVMHSYENSLGGTWFVMLMYFVLRFRFPPARPFGVAVVPLVLLMLGNGIQAGGVQQSLEPAYRSNWLYVHVLFAQITFGSYVLAFAAGVLYLVKERAGAGLLGRLPETKLLDELSFRLILFGFFAETVMIGSGAVWARGLWGRYWAWDPVETWSLISWITYGLNLHLRTTLGWRGRRAAWLAVASLLGVIVLFFGIGFVSGVHTGIF